MRGLFTKSRPAFTRPDRFVDAIPRTEKYKTILRLPSIISPVYRWELGFTTNL